jgi:mono/diheme cytochrome c family protein
MKVVLALLFSGAAWAEDGKVLFEQKVCYQCHGWQGQGGLAGPRLAQTKLTLAAFRAILREPPPGNMPPYRAALLSDAQIADIFAYIQSFPPPKAAADIPLLR